MLSCNVGFGKRHSLHHLLFRLRSKTPIEVHLIHLIMVLNYQNLYWMVWRCNILWLLTRNQLSLWIAALRLAICDLLHHHMAPLLQSDDLFAACLLFGHFLCLLLRLHHPVCLCGYLAKSLSDWWQFRFGFKVSWCFMWESVSDRFSKLQWIEMNWLPYGRV